ncbi:hypothetical protein A9996_15955 [Gelidibacter algens]|nr:hypothetical protein A9996_15955 [Gelidibacter algens]
MFLLFGLLQISAQTATDITNLQAPTLNETSGLIFYNNKLITHNDSGGDANLYEINTSSGAIERTVTIKNATNVDWEDIAQDASYIYIADIGNNSGSRTDLKIYKISKDDYKDADNTATPEIISYAYANQADFTPNLNTNNWDAEGLISYDDNLLIFSKNWVDNTVNVYAIPKTSGQAHRAILVSSYNTNGLITGADTSADSNVIFVTGYSSTDAPFMFTIHNIPNNSLDIFSGTVSDKISNIVPLGNQVEAIALFEITTTKHRLYLSNEKFVASVGPITISFPAKLWIIDIDTDAIALTVPDLASDFAVNCYPNPFDKILKLSERVDEISIYDLSGRRITKQHFVEELSLEHLNKGFYIAHIKVKNSKSVMKIIKK